MPSDMSLILVTEPGDNLPHVYIAGKCRFADPDPSIEAAAA